MASLYGSLTQIHEAYKAGTTIAELARKYKCNRQTILRFLRETGVYKKPKGNYGNRGNW